MKPWYIPIAFESTVQDVDHAPVHSVLDGQGRYQPVPVTPDGRYYSTVLSGFWLQVDWILATAPPAVLQALAQIVGS